jgi:EmrB/QacA subfamily drug resistance transporter
MLMQITAPRSEGRFFQLKTNKWVVLVITSLGTFMASINNSSINIANPILVRVFGIEMQQVQWVTTIFLLVVSSLMLLFGRIGDRIGGHKLYMTGLLIFCAGSLGCGLSGTFAMLVLARVLQALGAAMMMATGMGIVANTFPVEQRGMAMGFGILTVGIGSMCGPSLGAVVLAHLNWSYIFFLNLPFGITSLILALFFLRGQGLPTPATDPLDLRGAVLLAIVISSLILALSGGFSGSAFFFLLFAFSAFLFFMAEKKHPAPLWDFTLMQNQRFTLGNLVAFLSYFANMSVFFLMPFFLNDIWHLPIKTVGLLLVLSPLCMAVAGPLSGTLSDRIGALRLMPIALSVFTVALVLVFLLPATPRIPQLAAALLLTGIGMGMLNTPNNSEIMTAAGRKYASYAGSFVATNRNLAFCFGTATTAGLFPFLRSHFALNLGADAAYMVSLRCLVGFAIVVSLTSLFTCLWLKAHSTPKNEPAPQKP